MILKPKRKVSKFFIHCSDSDYEKHDNIETIREWHVTERGFDDIAYHFFINKKGEIFPCRDLEKIPASHSPHNTGSISICLSGKEDFTEKQFLSLQNLCNIYNHLYDREITFHGHCEVSNKECPVFDYKSVLHLTNKGYINESFM